eukprot:jgi/Picre1/33765/NNA_001244.t1
MMENSNRIKKYCILSGTAALVGYVAYEAYSRNLYDKTVRYIESVRNSVNKYRHAVDTGGDLIDMLVTDVYEYMSRESDDGQDGVPKSVKRLAALMQSDEVAASTKSTVRAVVEGLFSQGGDAKGQQSGSSLGALDKVLGALLSDKGQSLVSVALSMAASNAVKAYVEGSENSGVDRGLWRRCLGSWRMLEGGNWQSCVYQRVLIVRCEHTLRKRLM